MESNPGLSKGYIKAHILRHESSQKWTKLTTDLNALGPPMRELEGWKKVSELEFVNTKYE